MGLFKLFKPKKPLEIDGNYVYPLTSADQVIKSDGSRLEDEGGINADTLGGETPSSYLSTKQAVTVAQGGTGAKTAADARDNLGVPPKSHTSASDIYGKGSTSNYGHVRLSDSLEWSAADAEYGVAATPKAVQQVRAKADAALPKAGGTITGETKMKEDNPLTFLLPSGGAVKLLGHTGTDALIATVYNESGEWIGNAFAVMPDCTTRFQKTAIAHSTSDTLVRLRNGVIQDSAGTAVKSNYLLYRRK